MQKGTRSMDSFCGMCGAKVDPQTGLCPNCDREALEAAVVTAPVAEQEVVAQTMEDLVVEPVTASAAQQKQPVKKVAKAKKTNGGLTTVISVLGAICLLITLLASLVIYDVRAVIAEDAAQDILDNIALSDFLSANKDLAGGDAQKFINHMDKEYGVKITEKDVNEFLDQPAIKNYVAGEIKLFLNDYLEGDAELVISRSEVSELLQKNRRLLNKTFDADLSEEDLEKLANWVMESEDGTATITVLTSQTIKDSYPGVYYVSTIGLSQVVMWVFVALSLLIVFLLMRNSLTQGMLVTGILFTVVGGLNFCVAVVVTSVYSLWEMLAGSSVAGILIGNVLSAGLIPGGCLLAVGILLLIGRGVIVKARRKKMAAA